MKPRIALSFLLLLVLITGMIAPTVGAQQPAKQPEASPAKGLALDTSIAGVGTDYAWSQATGTYTEITGGTQLTTSCDDTNYNANSIPFTFTFNGTGYTQFSLNCNGFIAMGATVSSTYTPISSTSNSNVIAALGGDQQTGTTNSEIRYETLGTAPNQVLVIQWKNFRHYSGSQVYNYQIRLYETSNVVEVVYGTFTETTSYTSQVGLRGTTNADFNNRSGTGDWTASVAGTLNTATMALTTAYVPPSGLTWTWTPLAPHPVFDASYKLAPSWVLLDGSIAYTVHIKNTGTGPADSATLLDPIPAGTTYNYDVSCSSGMCGFDGTNVTWAGTVAVGGDETVSFSVATVGLPCGTVVTNQATMSDPGLLNGPVVKSASTLLVYAAPFVEDGFEVSVPPPGWTETIVDDPGTDPDWSQVTAGTYPTINPHGGTYMAKFNPYNAPAGASARLATFALDFSTAADPMVSFYMSHDTGYSANADRIQLQASTDGGLTWVDVGEPVLRYDAAYTTPGWGSHTLDLSAYAGQPSVMIGLLGISAYGNNFYVDDLTVLALCELVPEPNIVVTPEALSAEQCPDTVTQQTLQICNTGTADLTWSLTEAAPELGAGEVTLPTRAASEGKGTAAGPVPARAAGSYTTQGRAGIQVPPDVLLLAADDDNTNGSPIQALLQAYGDLGAVNLYDPRSQTPTLAELQVYEVVLVWSNYTFADAVAIGNVLADYVDAGGRVIDLMFGLDPSWGYQGRFRTEGYTAMTISSYTFGSLCLGTYNAGHPIMAGVSAVCEYYRGTGTVLTAGSSDIAQFSDGSLFVAAKDNQTVVTINGYVGYYFQWTGQMPDVVHNAILWLAGGAFDAPWLSEDPVSGTVLPGECQDVTVTFDSTGLAPDFYAGDLLIDSNDPDQPQVDVPVQLTVDPCMVYPDIEVTPVSLSTEQCPDEVTTQTLQVCNVGLADLTWTLAEQPAKQAALVPEGKPVVPHGASSDAAVQPFKPRINLNDILLITTTDTTGSVELALSELGYAFDIYYGSPWTGIDFSPYSTVLVAMDGGLAEVADIQKLRTDVIDMGKRAIFLGGTCYQPFAVGVNQYLVLNDTNNYCWSVSSTPHFTVINPADPLAQGLPSPYDFFNSSAAYYATRATDLDILTIALNGDGYADFFYKNNGWPVVEGSQPEAGGDLIWLINSPYYSYWANPNDYALLKQVIANSLEYSWAADIPWLSEDPISGTVPPGECADVTVTFDSTGLAAGDYFGNLLIDSNDPDEPQVIVPVQLTVADCVDTVHIGNLTGNLAMDPYGRIVARWYVQAHDDQHSALPDVMVASSIWDPLGGPYNRTRITKPSGWARFHWGRNAGGTFQLCVDNLTLAGYTYEPADNDVPNCLPLP